jgi:hypothetical protein
MCLVREVSVTRKRSPAVSGDGDNGVSVPEPSPRDAGSMGQRRSPEAGGRQLCAPVSSTSASVITWIGRP